MNNDQQIATDLASSADPLAVLLVNEFVASGTRASLGFPSEAEVSRSISENEERHFQEMKRCAEATDQRYERLMERARRLGSKSRNE